MTTVEVSITQGGGFCARLVFMLGYPTEDNRIQPQKFHVQCGTVPF
jgi:hypothetical protein